MQDGPMVRTYFCFQGKSGDEMLKKIGGGLSRQWGGGRDGCRQQLWTSTMTVVMDGLEGSDH